MKSPIILRIYKNNQLLEVKQFEGSQVIFGHDAEVNVDLNDDSVSAIHCLIELRDSGYYVCDMGSTTGTKKNGKTVLDEPISSGDNIEVGPFKVQFFVGAPKPKGPPTMTVAPDVVPPVPANLPSAAPKATAPVTQAPAAPMHPVAEKKTEAKMAPPKLPETPKVTPRVAPVQHVKGVKGSPTFAPPSEIYDLKSYLKPTKGPVVEVIVAWQERVLSTYHFGSDQKVTIGSSKKATVEVPSQFISGAVPFLELKGGCKVLAPTEAQVEIVNSSQVNMTMSELHSAGKVMKVGSANAVRLDQGELLCLQLGGGTLQIFVRYVPNTIKPLLGSPLDFTAGELTGLVISMVIVSLTALYMSVYAPPPPEEEKVEEQVRLAQFIYNKPPPTERPEPVPPPTPEKVDTPPPPPKEPTKVEVTDKEKQQMQKGNKESQNNQRQVEAAKAAEVRAKPTKVDRPKKFTSVKQGGATAVGKTASANAESAKDVSKMGLLSAFGGGGVRKQLDQAYSGSGELLGTADRATGTSGQNESRDGDDLGSKFKDTGAGGKGTATQGIAGIGTKGRGSGMSNYGSGVGLGGKGNVTIEPGGSDEGWDGTIDREAVRRVIRSILNQIKSCYERQLRVNSSIEGKIVIYFEIMEQGRVRTSRTSSSTMNDAAVESCVAARIREARFPEPPTGVIAQVYYPFVFGAQK